jgi:hypothetical protein
MSATPVARRKASSRRLWRYLAVYAVPVLAAALVGGGLYTFLDRAGEMTGPISAAQRQAETGEKYGAALVYRPFAFKLERYRQIQPEVLLVGSSRVMPFAGEAFSATVYNSGGAANNLDQAIAFVDAALGVHRPHAILLGLDYWWFNPNRDDEIDTTSQDSDEIELSLSQLRAPIDWMLAGKVTPGAFLAALSPFYTAPEGIGALAQFEHQGWDKHGRYDYGDLFDGSMKSDDEQFERTLERLRKAKASSKFSVAVEPSAPALAKLQGLIDRLQADGIEITLLLPPVAPPVLAQLTGTPENTLMPALWPALHGMGVPVIDVQDPATINSAPCEFIDGFHGGEVTYLRILDQIVRREGGILAQAIDHETVRRLIASNAGHARIDELRPEDMAPEIDFLALGCNKNTD